MKVVFVKHGIVIFGDNWAIEFADCVDGLHYSMLAKCDGPIKDRLVCISNGGWYPLPSLRNDDFWEDVLEVDTG